MPKKVLKKSNPLSFNIIPLGSSSAAFSHGRHLSGQILEFGHSLALIDCGEGTQLQLKVHGVKIRRIRHIYISHLHGDHYLGLYGLISTMNLFGRKEPLTIFGPRGLREIIQLHSKVSATHFLYPIDFVELKQEAYKLTELSGYDVETFPMKHRLPTNGFIFREQKTRRKVLMHRIPANLQCSLIGVLKEGKDVSLMNGEVLKAEDCTTPLPARSFAYCSDTAYNQKMIPYIKGVQLLYHEATFSDEFMERAKETMHSTGTQAAMIAKEAGVKQLLLGHFSARYDDVSPILKEAQKVFPNTAVVEEGKRYEID